LADTSPTRVVEQKYWVQHSVASQLTPQVVVEAQKITPRITPTTTIQRKTKTAKY
jgi:hypothetical protein